MKLLCTLASLVLLCTVRVQAFDCSEACDVLSAYNNVSPGYEIGTDTETYSAGSSVTVSAVSTLGMFRGIILQARRMGDFMTVGSLSEANHDQAEYLSCNTASDTVCLRTEDDLDTLTAMWQAPEPAVAIRFQAAFLDENDEVHYWNSDVLEPEEIEQEPEENLHDDTDEGEAEIVFQQKQIELIELENLASEDGQEMEAERERQEHDAQIRWEETQYEIEMKREEDERRARIQAEIRDKEEYDRMMMEEEERKRQEEEEEAERRRQEEKKRQEEEDRERNRTGFDEEVIIEETEVTEDNSAGVAVTSLVTIVAAFLLSIWL